MPFEPLDNKTQGLCQNMLDVAEGQPMTRLMEWYHRNLNRIERINAAVKTVMGPHMQVMSAHLNIGFLQVAKKNSPTQQLQFHQ